MRRPRRALRYSGNPPLRSGSVSRVRKLARVVFVQILGETRARYGFSLLGYVVMPKHTYPLISEFAEGTTSAVIKVLKQRVTRRLRRKKRKRAGQFSLEFVVDADGSQGFSAAPSKNSTLLPHRVLSGQERMATAVVQSSSLRFSPVFLCVLCVFCVKCFAFPRERKKL